MKDSPQLEDGYTRIANEILDFMCQFRIPGNTHRILLSIIRKTYGFHKKEDKIPNSQIAKMTGIHKAHVSRELLSLVTHKIVTNQGNKLSLNKNFSDWIGFDYGNSKRLPTRVTAVTNQGNKKLPTRADSKDNKDNIQKILPPTPLPDTTTPPVIKNNLPPPGKPINQMTYAERMDAIANNPNIIPEKLPVRPDRGGFRPLKSILADMV